MVNVTLNTKSRSCIASSIFLGYEGENQANKLVFSFDDEFVDGSAQLNIKRGNDNGYVALIKVGETYELEVKSSIVSKIGDVTFQLQISKSDGTIYKFDTFIMTVKDAIDSDIPLPEDYPSWQEAISTALAEMDNINISIDKVDTTTTVSVTDKKGAITEVEIHDGVDGKDGKNGKDGANGKDGKDGFSPIATVTQTDTGATISITDTNGTTIATVKNGKDGESGILEETDPVYSSEKSTLALKSELPTKLSQLQNDSEFITKTVNNLTNYYAKTEVDNLIPVVPTKVSELQNDSGYLKEYTETDPTVPNHVKGITQENITKWNNKSEFSGSYNDLTDKPTIPSVEGLATKEYVDDNTAAVIIYSDDTDETKISKLQEAAELSATSIVLNKTIYYYSKEAMALYILNMFGYFRGYVFIFNNILSEGGSCGIVQIELFVNEDKTTITIQNATTLLATTDSVLIKTNTTEFIPTSDYHPATKKYVDDAISASGTGGGIAELPIASAETLGGIRVGEGLEITDEGVLSAIGGGSVIKEFGEFEINQSTGTAITELMPIKVRGNMELSANGRIKLTPNKNYLFIINIKKITFTDSTGTCYHSLYFSNDLENRLYALEFYPEGTSTSYTNIRTLPKSLFTILSATETNNEISLYNSAKATSTPSIKLESIIDTIIVIEI